MSPSRTVFTIFEKSVLVDLELTDQARLTGQQTLGTHLSLPQLKAHISIHRTMTRAKGLHLGPQACDTRALPSAPSPQSCSAHLLSAAGYDHAHSRRKLASAFQDWWKTEHSLRLQTTLQGTKSCSQASIRVRLRKPLQYTL